MKYNLYIAASYGFGEPLVPISLEKSFDEFDDVFEYIKGLPINLKRECYFLGIDLDIKYFIEDKKDSLKISTVKGN